MNDYIVPLTLDLNCDKNQPVINSAQFDKGRILKITITADGNIFDITGCTAILKGVRNDKSHFAISCKVVDNKILISTDEDVLSAHGFTVAKIVLSDLNRTYSTQMFLIDVDNSLEGDITTDNNYSILNTLIEQVRELQAVSGMTESQVEEKLKNYISIATHTADLKLKEDTTNKISNFNSTFADESGNKYPTVLAIMNYLKSYYYDYAEIDSMLEDLSGGSITEEDLAQLKAELSQIEPPTFVESIEECTDPAKLYVLPDGYIYAYTTKTTTHIPVNQIINSINTDGTPYGNGLGYITGYTIHGSTGADYAGSSVDRVTGYIKCKNDDYIRSKGISFASTAGYRRIALYDKDFVCLTVLSVGSTTKPLDDYLDGENLSFNISGVASNLLSNEQKQKVEYIRVSCNDIDSNSIVTINESTETTSETVTAFHKTNNAFIPTDYEDRIIALENSNSHAKSRHAGKVCVCFGDSIVGNMPEPDDYPTVLANETGMTVYNVGFGGCRMSASMSTVYNAYSMVKLSDAITTGVWTEQEAGLENVTISHYAPHIETLKNIDWNKVDFITIGYGTNDIANFVDVDNAENPLDTTTVLGGLRYSLNTILTAYPHIKVLILTPIYRYFNNEGVDSDEKEWYEQRKFTTWTDGILEVAKEYRLPAVDMYRTLGFNKITRSYYFPSNDGTHPNKIGLKVIAGKIAGKLLAEY